jgi:hypothetical protein
MPLLIAVRETGDKIEILDQDHDSMALALERALEGSGANLKSWLCGVKGQR